MKTDMPCAEPFFPEMLTTHLAANTAKRVIKERGISIASRHRVIDDADQLSEVGMATGFIASEGVLNSEHHIMKPKVQQASYYGSLRARSSAYKG